MRIELKEKLFKKWEEVDFNRIELNNAIINDTDFLSRNEWEHIAGTGADEKVDFIIELYNKENTTKTIYKLTFDWHQVSDGSESSEDYSCVEVGVLNRMVKSKVTKIVKCEPKSKGDLLSYEIHHENGEVLETYNPNLTFKR